MGTFYYLTYGGLIRVVRNVIINFVEKCIKVNKQEYSWHVELPGTLNVQLSPIYWAGRSCDDDGSRAIANLEGFLKCLYSTPKEVLNMEECITRYLKHISQMKLQRRYAALSLSCVYVFKVSNISEEFKRNIIEQIERNKNLLKDCNIYNILVFNLTDFNREEIVWEVDDFIEEVEKYNKNKYKKNQIKLPVNIETNMYMMIAENMIKDERAEFWYIKTYRNCVNYKDLQEQIALRAKELGYNVKRTQRELFDAT